MCTETRRGWHWLFPCPCPCPCLCVSFLFEAELHYVALPHLELCPLGVGFKGVCLSTWQISFLPAIWTYCILFSFWAFAHTDAVACIFGSLSLLPLAVLSFRSFLKCPLLKTLPLFHLFRLCLTLVLYLPVWFGLVCKCSENKDCLTDFCISST